MRTPDGKMKTEREGKHKGQFYPAHNFYVELPCVTYSYIHGASDLRTDLVDMMEAGTKCIFHHEADGFQKICIKKWQNLAHI